MLDRELTVAAGEGRERGEGEAADPVCSFALVSMTPSWKLMPSHAEFMIASREW